jgi:hypothetical protein
MNFVGAKENFAPATFLGYDFIPHYIAIQTAEPPIVRMIGRG